MQEFLTNLPKEAWFAFGTIATVFSTFVIGLFGIKTRRTQPTTAPMTAPEPS